MSSAYKYSNIWDSGMQLAYTWTKYDQHIFNPASSLPFATHWYCMHASTRTAEAHARMPPTSLDAPDAAPSPPLSDPAAAGQLCRTTACAQQAAAAVMQALLQLHHHGPARDLQSSLGPLL